MDERARTSPPRVEDVLFPLPFTAFEYYYWSDDTPEYPTTFPFDLRFSGVLDKQAFLVALRQAHARHPLLTALVNDDTRIPCWIDGAGCEPFVDWADESVPITHPRGEQIDLRKEVGLRVWVRTGATATRLLLQFHHACLDGMGTMKFVEDLFVGYAAAVDGGRDGAPLPERDAEQLRKRGYFAATEYANPSLSIAIRDVAIAVREWSGLLLRGPAPVAAPRAEIRVPRTKTSEATQSNATPGTGVDRPPLFEFETHTLNAATVGRLREVASSGNATLNDLMLRDMFLVLRQWNRQYDGRLRGRVRLNVPVNLREGDEQSMPAANRIGYAFVTDEPGGSDDPIELLKAVHQETERIKWLKLGLYFLGGLELASRIPGVVPWALRRNLCMATMVLSNVGHMFSRSPLPRRNERVVVGNAVLESIAAVPPLRPLTRAGLAIFEYAGGMTLALKCDRRFFDPHDTQALLNAYVRQLQETCQRGT